MYVRTCLLVAALFSVSSALATNLPDGFTESLLASGLNKPVSFDFAPDGRVFICEQAGTLRVFKNGSLLGTPFLSVTTDSNGDRGLLGVAVDPNFSSNQFIYVIYTVPAGPNNIAHNVVSRFTADGDVAAPGSEVQIFNVTGVSDPTIKACCGMIMFGPDGKLYVSQADNWGGNAAQDLGNMMGKMLRINTDGSIPTDNPFFNNTSGDNRAIWAIGLRNAFSYAFQPGTGRMMMNDVGTSLYEEIDDGKAGGNYGWPSTEGPTNVAGYISPIHSYPHTGDESGCAITGGTFYNPSVSQFPSQFVGMYFYMDYCNGWMRALDLNTLTPTLFATSMPQGNTILRTGPDGSLYYMNFGNGWFMRIQYAPAVDPTITQQPSNVTVTDGSNASFSVSSGGSAPFNYQWQQNGTDIPGANSSTLTLNGVTVNESGSTYHCTVSNTYGSATSNDATLTVTPYQPPVVNITAPTAGTLYTAGSSITYSGTANDPQEGALPASAYTWEIDQVRPLQTRPFMQPTSGFTQNTMTFADTGETAPDVVYRFILTAQNSRGLKSTVSVDVSPKTVNVQVASNPTGLQLSLDSQPATAPINFTGVVGFKRTLGAATSQTVGGSAYQFINWSDGGTASHLIVTPTVDTVYTANYQLVVPPPPPAISTLTANPGTSVTQNTPVQFNCQASGSGALTWLWDYGDGSTSTDAVTTQHTYTQTGNYIVSVTVTDTTGLSANASLNLSVLAPGTVITGGGGNGDGGGGGGGGNGNGGGGPGGLQNGGGTNGTLTVTHLSAGMNFAHAGNDNVAFAATFSANNVPAQKNGVIVNLDVDGASSQFTLNAQGRSTTLHGRVQLSVIHGNVALKAKLSKGTWCQVWTQSIDRTSKAAVPLDLPVTITIGNQALSAVVSGKYMAKSSSTGLFKQ